LLEKIRPLDAALQKLKRGQEQRNEPTPTNSQLEWKIYERKLKLETKEIEAKKQKSRINNYFERTGIQRPEVIRHQKKSETNLEKEKSHESEPERINIKNTFKCGQHKVYFSERESLQKIRLVKRLIDKEKSKLAQMEIDRVINKKDNSHVDVREMQLTELVSKLNKLKDEKDEDSAEVKKLENEVRGLVRVIRGGLEKVYEGRKSMAPLSVTAANKPRLSLNIGRFSSLKLTESNEQAQRNPKWPTLETIRQSR